jgi:hypothetical protein
MKGIAIRTAIGQSFGFVPVAWRRAWPALTLMVALTVTNQALAMADAGPAIGLLRALASLAQLGLAVMAMGALYRIVLEADHAGDPAFRPGAGGIQWGALEWRVLAAGVISGLLIGALVVALLVAWGMALAVMAGTGALDADALRQLQGGGAAAAAAVASLLQGPAGLATLAILLPGAVLVLYLSARLSLFGIRAADQRSFDLGAAWSLTRGVTGAIVAALIVIGLIELVAGAFAGLLGGAAGAVAGAVGGAGAVPGGRILGSVAGAAVGAALNTPLVAGLVTFVYRSQRAGTGVAEQFS